MKNIHGKQYPYLQKREGSKVISQIVPGHELEELEQKPYCYMKSHITIWLIHICQMFVMRGILPCEDSQKSGKGDIDND